MVGGEGRRWLALQKDVVVVVTVGVMVGYGRGWIRWSVVVSGDMSNKEVKSNLSSAAIIGGNQDILTEILLRIPAKSLFKFKCVSKQWLSVISDPKFCLSHTRHKLSRYPTPNALLLKNQYSSSPEFQVVPLKDATKVPFLDYLNVPRIKIERSCNGLLLCSSASFLKTGERLKNELGVEGVPVPPANLVDHSSYVINGDDLGRRYFICNPTTREFKRLPFPSYILIPELLLPHYPWLFYPWIFLAFDPMKSPYYKIILLRMMSKTEIGIDVYSSKTESWTRAPTLFERPLRMFSYDGIFCNGAIYWYSKAATSVYFDVDSETVKKIAMPPMLKDMPLTHISYFGESRGHLNLVGFNNFSNLSELYVWEMPPNHCGWLLRYLVDLHSIRENPRAISVLSVIRTEKEEESMLVLLMDGGRVVSYNTCDGTSNKLCDLEPRTEIENNSGKLDYNGRDVYQYFETLISFPE
ncbi:unnamed protein product [Dovyalis caffra]|uniref:F-box domain-containing protein n=1 Tax=Dovyalis caffra TaxID=77055 RepID=A0AAV1RRQ2_9ROSI|nr:unnamed protein product [Dovyalis caffra]